jgi:hypothetical protein
MASQNFKFDSSDHKKCNYLVGKDISIKVGEEEIEQTGKVIKYDSSTGLHSVRLLKGEVDYDLATCTFSVLDKLPSQKSLALVSPKTDKDTGESNEQQHELDAADNTHPSVDRDSVNAAEDVPCQNPNSDNTKQLDKEKPSKDIMPSASPRAHMAASKLPVIEMEWLEVLNSTKNPMWMMTFEPGHVRYVWANHATEESHNKKLENMVC